MPSRASASARLGPTPFKYFTEVVSCNVTPLPPPPFPGGSPLPGLSPAHEPAREPLRVERLQVFEPLSRAEKADRDAHRPLERDHTPALCGPVELRDDQTGERHGRREGARLLHGVLPDRGVEHEQRLVRRTRLLLRRDPHHLLQ